MDQSVRGIKKMMKEDPAKAKEIVTRVIKNTYRTLMTRGMKGCYVYCCDEELANYLKSSLTNSKIYELPTTRYRIAAEPKIEYRKKSIEEE